MLERIAWGKRCSTDGNIETDRLGLIEHSIDVAAVFESLVAIPLIRRRLETLAKTRLTESQIARLAVLAFLHDLGKASVGFQSKSIEEAIRPSWLAKAKIGFNQCGHTRVVAGVLFNSKIKDRFPLAEMVFWGESLLDLWLAAISHHGTPIVASELQSAPEKHWQNLWNPTDGYDPMDTIAALGGYAQRWFPAAWGDGPRLPQEAPFIHFFAGLVSLADWIASNDRDDFFPYSGDQEGRRAEFSRVRARQALRWMRIDVEDARADLRRRNPAFEDVFPFKPTDLQQKMEDRQLGPVVIAESETGSGKTEAALWRFKTLFEAGEVDALAFLLPTRVAAVSLEQRVRRFFEGAFPDPQLRPNVVLAVPGYLQSDGEQGMLLSRFETLWPDSAADGAAHRRWAAEHPKRYLAAACAVGTVDQALLSGLTTRHAHLRGAALLRALVVVDEVHASDAYMTQLLTGILRRHTAAGGHALLLSATLGSEARERLLDKPLRRPKIGRDKIPVEDDTGTLARVPYPAVSDKAALHRIASNAKEKRIGVRLASQIDDPDWIAAKATDAARQGAKVLVVRNTVQGAIAVHSAIEDILGDDHPVLFRAKGVSAPHHGRFAARDRRVLDEAIELSFGKDAARGTGTILVGTQTLEQSLDIDADFLIVDLAPADVLLQRLGRLHRHSRKRPDSFASPTVIVLTPSSRNLAAYLRKGQHGIGSVYENILSCEATWQELRRRDELVIPTQNRALVESATRFSALESLAKTLGKAWESHLNEYIGSDYAKRGAADAVRLDWSEPWDTQGWSEPKEQVRTRLGLNDRQIELSERWGSPFGEMIDRLNIPGWMAEGIEPSEEKAEVKQMTMAELLFCWGTMDFSYSRRGLARLEK